MPVNSRYNRPFTTTPTMPSAIATITSSRKNTMRVIRNSPAQAFVDLHLIVSKVLISAGRA